MEKQRKFSHAGRFLIAGLAFAAGLEVGHNWRDPVKTVKEQEIVTVDEQTWLSQNYGGIIPSLLHPLFQQEEPPDNYPLRKKVLEEIALRGNDPGYWKDLLRTAAVDDHSANIRELAQDMLNSLKERGDFSGSRPYKEAESLEERVRKIGTFTYRSPPVQTTYNPNSPLSARENSIERLVFDPSPTEELITFLRKVIVHEEEDVSKLARMLVDAYEKTGSFDGIKKIN